MNLNTQLLTISKFTQETHSMANKNLAKTYTIFLHCDIVNKPPY